MAKKGIYITYEQAKTALSWAKTVYSEFDSITDNYGLENKLRKHLKDNNL